MQNLESLKVVLESFSSIKRGEMGSESGGRNIGQRITRHQEPESSFELSNPASFSDLQVGMKMYGIVNRVKRFSALVDIGFSQKAFVSFSEIKRCGARYASDLLKVGYVVLVEVKRLDIIERRVSVSLPLSSMTNVEKTVSRKANRDKRSGLGKRRKRAKNKRNKKRPLSKMPNPQFLKSQTTRTTKKVVLPIKNQAGFSNSSNDWDDLAWKNRFGKRKRKIGF